MSRTLKRPMFRDGGRANSKGTGIMTGIEDREPYAVGGTSLDPYVSGPFQPEPKKYYLNELFVPKIGSGIIEGQKASTLNFLNKTVPGIQKEGTTNSTFSLIPKAEASELPIVTSSPKKTEQKKPEEKPETTKANQPGGRGLDEDLDDIKLEDFEEEITKKAEIYEKLLGGKDARTQAAFRALTAGGLKALQEGDVVSGLQEGFEKLEGIDDLSRKARLLAIQEKIERDAQKTPTKAQEVEILAKRYMDNGMKAADAYAAAEKKVYGSEKDSTLPPRDPQRYLQDVTLDFLKLAQDNEVIALNPSGFAKASILRQEGIPTITYSEEYDANQDKYVVVKSKSHDELSPGEYAFDPVESLFLYKNKKGEKGKASSQSDAIQKSGQ